MNFHGLQEKLSSWGVTISSMEADKCMHHLALLNEWNSVFNLTAIRDPMQMYEEHIWDSLWLREHLLLSEDGASILDIGSGAGFPGIPLAVTLPHISFTLAEPRHKRFSFLTTVRAKIKLNNTTVVNLRIQDMQEVKFSIFLSRAVGSMENIILWGKHLATKNSTWAFLKSSRGGEELSALRSQWHVEKFERTSPGSSKKRYLFVLRAK